MQLFISCNKKMLVIIISLFAFFVTSAYAYTQIAMGVGHFCAIKNDNSIKCFWGTSGDSAYGSGTLGEATDQLGSFNSISAGTELTVFLRNNGNVGIMGNNDFGQSPSLSTADSFTQVSAGGEHSCALDYNGKIHCWGAVSVPPSFQNTTFRQISAGGTLGNGFTCAIRNDNDNIVCWSNFSTSSITTSIPSGSFKQISTSVGGSHACAIRTNNTLTCWGDNNFNQAPTVLIGDYVQVSAGLQHTCALKRNINNDVIPECWGGNGHHQSNLPSAPPNTFTQVSSGGTDTCWLKNNGNIVCKGYQEYYNGVGQFNDNSSSLNSYCATFFLFANPQLFVPCIQVGSQHYSAGFNLQTFSPPVKFYIAGIPSILYPPTTASCATFDATTNNLEIPCLTLGWSQTYWLKLILNSSSLFDVSGFGSN